MPDLDEESLKVCLHYVEALKTTFAVKTMSGNMMKLNKTISSFLTTFLFISLMLCFSGCGRPKRDLYLIPEGYAGWLGISYGIANAPALEIENGYRVIRFSSNGFVETSSLGIPGPGKDFDDQYYYYNGTNRRPVNLADELGGGGTIQEQSNVGTGRYISRFWISGNAKADYEKYVKDKPVQYGQFKGYVPPSRQ